MRRIVSGAALAFTAACAGCAGDRSSLRRAQTYRNVSAAMDSTLREGEMITAELLPDSGAVARDVRHGDVVVHAWPLDTTKEYVKRVVGLPGDTLAMRDGALLRSGRPVAEPYAWHAEGAADPVFPEFEWQREYAVGHEAGARPPSRNNWGPLVVPPGSYFVLGDNRDDSLDSRFWGFLRAGHIRGIVTPLPPRRPAGR